MRTYIIYDGRACGDQPTDDAAIMFVVGEDFTEALETMPMYGQCALYSYEKRKRGLDDERWEADYHPAEVNALGKWVLRTQPHPITTLLKDT